MTNATDKPWEHEPDHVMFMSEAGYVCEIMRHPSLKHLCGYIFIPFGHPDCGKDYNELYESDENWDAAPDVHGGWTFDNTTPEYTKFGFDCGHGGDMSPGITDIGMQFDGDIYRDIEYVTAQLEHAARQFKEREKP